MTRLEARALLDDGMIALAVLMDIKDLKPNNASHKFRQKLDEGCPQENLATATSDPLVIQADDTRRKGVLEGLLRDLINKLQTPGAAKSPKLVPKKYIAALINSLQSILASKETMEALSDRNHIIRTEGNDSAHTTHSLASLTKLQVRIKEDENHPLAENSKVAIHNLAQLFIDVPHLLLPL